MDLLALSAAVVHEVKNRLAELELRLEARGDAEVELALTTSCAQRLTELLLLQREQSGTLQANIDGGSPTDLLTELVAEYHVLFPRLQLEVDEQGAPPLAYFDAFLLRLALGNALHNACRFARTTVGLCARDEGAGVVFEIADDGPGYPEALLSDGLALPQPMSEHGTGLGLYLARRIAALHQLNGQSGRIEMLNRGGAVFRLHLP